MRGLPCHLFVYVLCMCMWDVLYVCMRVCVIHVMYVRSVHVGWQAGISNTHEDCIHHVGVTYVRGVHVGWRGDGHAGPVHNRGSDLFHDLNKLCGVRTTQLQGRMHACLYNIRTS